MLCSLWLQPLKSEGSADRTRPACVPHPLNDRAPGDSVLPYLRLLAGGRPPRPVPLPVPGLLREALTESCGEGDLAGQQ